MPVKRADGVKLFYEVSGAGEPLVLVPRFEIETIEGADHAPHQTTTKQYVDLIRRFHQE